MQSQTTLRSSIPACSIRDSYLADLLIVCISILKGAKTLSELSLIKIYDNTLKNSLRRKCSKVIFIAIKIVIASYIIFCC